MISNRISFEIMDSKIVRNLLINLNLQAWKENFWFLNFKKYHWNQTEQNKNFKINKLKVKTN